MPISLALFHESIDLIAGIQQLEMDPQALADDIVLLDRVWHDKREFKSAITSVHKAIEQLVQGAVSGTPLKNNHKDWMSYHFQHRRSQGGKADMRIVYQLKAGRIRVRGFGHRHLPVDIYRRLNEERR